MSEQEQARRVGVDALKALAHPLRVRLYSELSAYGPSTASVLAARLGESSGATSYHLRQLEKHGFVREDPDRGNARDRWWERVPGPIELADAVIEESPAAREAGDLVEMELARLQNERYARFWSGRAELPDTWRRVAGGSSANLQLTAAEAEELDDAMLAVVSRYRGRSGGDDRRRVDVLLRIYPVTAPDVLDPVAEDGESP